MKPPISILAATLSVAALFGACGHKKPRVQEPAVILDAGPVDAAPVDAAPPPTLYDHLGGREGVAGVVETLLSNVTADKRVNKLFAKSKGDHLELMLRDEICVASGGPCTYSGKSMKEAHAGMGITEAQWSAFIEDLTLALEEKQVSKEDQDALLAKLMPLKDDIVEKKPVSK
jgi:hemoglobin